MHREPRPRARPRGRSPLAPLRRAWARFWRPPDPFLLQSGASGELAIAKARLLVVAGLLGLTLEGANLPDPGPEASVRLWIAATALALALPIYLVVKRVAYRWWIGFATSGLDVSLVSLGLALYLAVGEPHAALNSQVIYPVYFVALAAATMRLDHRVCALASVVAVGQYAVLVSWASAGGGLNAPEYAPFPYGEVHLGAQISRAFLLGAMGMLATVVIRRVQRPHLDSAVDGLTGLMNRRHFEERWEGELSRARRYGRPVSVAAVDIDRFKQFNDTHGHAAGDAALRAVARALRRRLRSGDFVARWGGEEFLVALPETGPAEALEVAEKLRRAVAESTFELPGQRTPVALTVSVGVASWPEHGNAIDKLLGLADKHLYEAKLGGRDRVQGPELGRVLQV